MHINLIQDVSEKPVGRGKEFGFFYFISFKVVLSIKCHDVLLNETFGMLSYSFLHVLYHEMHVKKRSLNCLLSVWCEGCF